MMSKIKLSELAEFDPSKYLDDDKAIADYIRLAIEDGDPGLLAAAQGDVARARGMTQVAQAAGLTREARYKPLRPEARPRFDTIQKVCRALGVRLTATADEWGQLANNDSGCRSVNAPRRGCDLRSLGLPRTPSARGAPRRARLCRLRPRDRDPVTTPHRQRIELLETLLARPP